MSRVYVQYINTHTHTHTYTHTRIHTHAYTHMHTHTMYNTHTHTHVRTHAHTHTHNTQCTHAHAHAHTHTHTHTHTQHTWIDICIKSVTGIFASLLQHHHPSVIVQASKSAPPTHKMQTPTLVEYYKSPFFCV